MSDDFYDEFAGRGGDGERHPAWAWTNEDGSNKPVGTVFTGRIEDRWKWTEKKGKNAGKSRIAYTMDTADGPMVLFISQWQLEKELAAITPQIGDGLKIRYDGIDPEDGQSKRFTVKVEVPPAQPGERDPLLGDTTDSKATAPSEYSEEPF